MRLFSHQDQLGKGVKRNPESDRGEPASWGLYCTEFGDLALQWDLGTYTEMQHPGGHLCDPRSYN